MFLSAGKSNQLAFIFNLNTIYLYCNLDRKHGKLYVENIEYFRPTRSSYVKACLAKKTIFQIHVNDCSEQPSDMHDGFFETINRCMNLRVSACARERCLKFSTEIQVVHEVVDSGRDLVSRAKHDRDNRHAIRCSCLCLEHHRCNNIITCMQLCQHISIRKPLVQLTCKLQ